MSNIKFSRLAATTAAVLLPATMAVAQDTTTVRTDLLATLDKGPWPCKYYWPNSNADVDTATAAKWYVLNEDESDWIDGVGPFSNSNDQFLTTEWGSGVRPILIRRHFTLTADQVTAYRKAEVILAVSYDENPVVYLNGRQLWTATGWNDNDYATFQLLRQRRWFREGDNVLCVSLLQGAGGGHIDYGLYVNTTTGISAVAVDEESNAGAFYSVSGMNMGTSAQALPAGVYIKNGKKLIIR